MKHGLPRLLRMPFLCKISLGFLFAILPFQTLHAASPTCPEVKRANTSARIFPSQENKGDPSIAKKESKPVFARDRIIVKFKDTLTEPADILYGSEVPFAKATADKGSELDELNRIFQVKKITPVFQAPALAEKDQARRGTRSGRKQLFAEWLEGSRTRHAKRSARAAVNSSIPDISHIYTLSLPDGTDIQAACKSYSANPNVEYAVPSYTMLPQAVTDDPYFSSRGSWGNSYDDMWALKKIKADVAWDTASGDGAVVAVVDSGIDYNHVDLAENVWSNTAEAAGAPGADDDHNGYIDDSRGWYFDYDIFGNDVSNNEVMDTDGHGTFVAGIIGAVGNNGTGIIGVAPKARIMPVKVMSSNGYGYTEPFANGILYAAQNGADVINLSWGCSDCSKSAGNPLITDAIRIANGLGAVVVVAAGDWGSDVKDAFPADVQDVITVSSTDGSDNLSTFSNRGFFVDVAAPGGRSWNVDADALSILSLRAAGTTPFGMAVGEGYMRSSGTSASAAYVSGVAALVLSANPALTREQVISIIRHSADDLVGSTTLDSPGYDPFFGWGRVNAAKAVSMAGAPPFDPPVMEIQPAGFSFNVPQLLCGQDRSFSFDIYNVGGGNLIWNLAAPSWLTPVTTSGTAYSAAVMKLSTNQTVNGAISVSSNGSGAGTREIPVSVTVQPDIKLSNCSMALSAVQGNEVWDADRNVNSPGIPDGSGGAYYVWYDTAKFHPDVSIQRIDSNGNMLWAANGLRPSSSEYTKFSPAIISDGAGGAIVIWIEGLNSGDYGDKNIRAQRINSAGELLWGSAGIDVTLGGSTTEPVIIPDGSGGAIVGWTYLGSNDDLYAQRVSASGALLWQKGGVAVSKAADAQFGMAMAEDGSGGAYLAWVDRRRSSYDIYGQHLNMDGVPLWQGDGMLLSTQQVSSTGPNIVADGKGGAIVAWHDFRNFPLQTGISALDHGDIYAVRLNGEGQHLWNATGVPVVSGLTASPARISPFGGPDKLNMISDGQGGAIFGWLDIRNRETTVNAKWDIYAQRINGAGEPVWALEGIPVIADDGGQNAPTLIPDGDGGAMFAWQDARFGNFDIFIQQVKAAGSLRWGRTGVWVHSGSKDQVNPYMVPLGGNRLAITWDDESLLGQQEGIDFRGEVVQLCTDHDGDGFYAEGGVCGQVNLNDPVLAILRAGTGQGSVQSLPSGINCGADCSRRFAPGSTVTLKAVAAPGSTFSGWSGGDCSGTGECIVTPGSDTTIQAIFSATLPVKIAESWSGIYTSPQHAYNNALNGNTIIARAQSFSENLNMNLPVTVHLVGGYDADFVNKVNYTEINGTVTIGQGSVTVDSVVIK